MISPPFLRQTSSARLMSATFQSANSTSALRDFLPHDRLEFRTERLHELPVDQDRRGKRRRRQIGHRLGDVVILEGDERRGGGDHSVDGPVLHRRQRLAERQRHRQDADLLERLDLDRRAALGADLLSLEIGDRANALVREQHQRAVDAGRQDFHALVGAEGRQPAADRRGRSRPCSRAGRRRTGRAHRAPGSAARGSPRNRSPRCPLRSCRAPRPPPRREAGRAGSPDRSRA